MHRFVLIVSVLTAVACGEGTRASSGAATAETGSSCLLTVSDSLEVYSRPDPAASIWGWVIPGDTVTVWVKTAEGWLGFDPGTAQAGNSGSFRYRWVDPDASFSLIGNTGSVEEVWGPSAGITYAMTFDPVPVHVEPDTVSMTADSLPGGSAASIVSRRDGWFLVDTSDGPSPGTLSGWILAGEVGISGDLDSIPDLGDPVLPH